MHDDPVAEGDETLALRLTDPHGLAMAVATGTIEDDDTRGVTVQPRELNVPEGGTAHFQVSLASQATAPVTVAVASASEELTAAPVRVDFAPDRWARAQTVSVTAVRDDDALADEPVQLTLTASGGGYDGATASVRATIVETDVATLAVVAAQAAEGDGTLRFAVTLSLADDQAVTVDYTTRADGESATEGWDYTLASGTLRFPALSTAAQTIEVTLLDDTLDEPDEQFTLVLRDATAPLAGGGDTLAATGTIEDDDPPPRLSIDDASLTEGDGDGNMRFAVTLAPASARPVTVRYTTADATATAGADYTTVDGTLTFPAGSTVRSIAVPVADDALDEADTETFTMTLSAAENASLAGTGAETGTVHDNDAPPRLSIDDASLTEGDGDGNMRFAVTLAPASGRTVTVRYATADATATAGADYTALDATLTFPAGSTVRSIAVPVVDDQDAEDTETLTVSLSNPQGAVVSAATATGTVSDDGDVPPLELASLHVTGGGTMYPVFTADTYHYALTCEDPDTLQVAAQARNSDAQLTLLRDDSDNDQTSTGSLDAQLSVNENHDIAIQLSDTGGTVTYVVHCLPSDYPDINILKKEAGASEGLLFLTPLYVPGDIRFKTIVDYNGVSRFQAPKGANFRPQPNGPTIGGRRVKYSFNQGHRGNLLDGDFELVRTVEATGDLTSVNPHDFLVTDEGTFLLISYHQTTRDLSEFSDADGNPLGSAVRVTDSVIQEVSRGDQQRFLWNSWDHVKLDPDCRLVQKARSEPAEYGHLNSLQIVDGDIIASMRGCSQVLRIDRSSGTGAVEWQMGGTEPPRDPDTAYLELVNDPAGEFCKQHQVTLTDANTVVMFDNGTGCLGARKKEATFTRIVEYDISSGTQATFLREYRRPAGQGYSRSKGGVTVLDNGNWLITWGNTDDATAGAEEIIAISEVDPVAGTSVFEMNMSKWDELFQSYRVYLLPESEVSVPLNLP